MSAVMHNARLRSAQQSLDSRCDCCCGNQDAYEQADFDVHTDPAAIRECVTEAAGTSEQCIDALLALRDAEACGVFTALKLRQPLNVIQTEALARLGREARQWYGKVEEEINNEVSRRVAA